VRIAWDGKDENYNRVPAQDELDLDPDAAYVHITSNETIQGVQFPSEPEVGDVPLVCDSSSDFLCRPVPIEKYGILYACAQKNAGPAGVTIVIIRDDLVQRSPGDLPTMLSYKEMADGKSLANTPPVFSVYMVKLVTEWLLSEIGGLEKMEQINKQKVELVLDAVQRCGGFYDVHARPNSRSLMNVAFRLANPELDGPFLKAAEDRGLAYLKGHRSVGGCRASIYNAMPIEGVQLLRDFMVEFCEKNK
jgi:phosphoserine aminotransferase